MHKILPGIELVIFDMDGLLVDSEPYWKMAEKKVFGRLGLQLTDELLRQVMGFRLNEVVKHWYNYQPWEHPDFLKTELEVLETVKQLILVNAEAMPGVYETLNYFKNKKYKIALASSSAMVLIEAVVDKLNMRPYFDLLWSAQYEEYGKPHPAVFISVANKLGVAPQKCLVVEDAINGVIAAKAAKMNCLAVPEQATFNDPRFAIADLKIETLAGFFT
ncbi:MAG: hexitol phosphatase HxpB [Bacteroidota bacterium]